MSKGAPDYSKLVLLQALDGSGNLIPVLLDSSGKIISVLQGIDASAVLRTLKVDTSGQLIAVIKGSGGENITVDANGFLGALMKGVDASAVLRTLKVDTNGQLIAVIKGSGGENITVDANGFLGALMKGNDGGTLRTVAVDGSGQIVTVPRGQSGNYVAVDASGNMSGVMKGLDGATLRTVAVDSSGNIIGVLKGDYGGALKTLATDDAGRLLAKIYDPSDIFGVNLSVGLAEHAARTGSMMTFDRRGQFLWGDDFQMPVLKWNAYIGGAGAAPVLSTARAYTGARSVFLNSGTGLGSYSGIQKYLTYYSAQRMGLEAIINIASVTGSPTLRCAMYKYDGSTVKKAEIYYNITNTTLAYLNSSGGVSAFDASVMSAMDFSLWYPFKLVVDFSTNKYVRCLYSGTEYDLSTNNIYSAASATSKRIEILIYIVGSDTSGASEYVDGVVVTVNEP